MSDGMHPSELGREKVAKMLLEFPEDESDFEDVDACPGSGADDQGRQREPGGAPATIYGGPSSSPVGRIHGAIDLGTGTYKGEQGGLYPGGSNTVPPEHLKAASKIAQTVVLLDADGRPSPNVEDRDAVVSASPIRPSNSRDPSR